MTAPNRNGRYRVVDRNGKVTRRFLYWCRTDHAVRSHVVNTGNGQEAWCDACGRTVALFQVAADYSTAAPEEGSGDDTETILLPTRLRLAESGWPAFVVGADTGERYDEDAAQDAAAFAECACEGEREREHPSLTVEERNPGLAGFY
jgi:hypothetical protein